MMSAGETGAGRGPAVPSASAAVAHRPLAGDGARLTAGLLHAWQQRNAGASLPLALRQLETAGTWPTCGWPSRAPARGPGPVFMDSDIYKVLEAIGWELGGSPTRGWPASWPRRLRCWRRPSSQTATLNSCIQVTGRARYSFLAWSGRAVLRGPTSRPGRPRLPARRRGSALLAVARRFADHLVDHFLGGQEGIDGHPIVESALAELYRETGHEPYLRLARQFIEQRGHGLIGDSGFGHRYLQDHQPVPGHGDPGRARGPRAVPGRRGRRRRRRDRGARRCWRSSLTRWADMVATERT